MSDALTLADLSEATGIPARTIRFYIARGLLEGPLKAGRDAAYSAEHIARLEEIKRWQAEGRRLADIASLTREPEALPPGPEPAAWWQHAVADDVQVWVRAGASPWRIKRIRESIDELRRRISEPERGERT